MGTITVHNNENFATWVEDLATTNAPQVRQRLAATMGSGRVGFCCLGRGIECAGDAIPVEFDEARTDYVYVKGSVPWHTDTMPPAVWLTWIGVDPGEDYDGAPLIDWPKGLVTRMCSTCGVVDDDKALSDVCHGRLMTSVREHTLASYLAHSGTANAAALNDECNLTFAQIADVLRYFGIKDHL